MHWLRNTMIGITVLITAASMAEDSVMESGKSEVPQILARQSSSTPAFYKLLSLKNNERELSRCCKVCTAGKACGNTCIAAWMTCHVGPGCACNG